jgi:hypothetical protein
MIPARQPPAAVVAAGPVPDITFENFRGASCGGGSATTCEFTVDRKTSVTAEFKHQPVIHLVVDRPLGSITAVAVNNPNSVSAGCDQVCGLSGGGVHDGQCTAEKPCIVEMPEGLRPTITAWGSSNAALASFSGCPDEGTLFCQLPPLVDDVTVTIKFIGASNCSVSGERTSGPCDYPPQFGRTDDRLHFGLAITQGCKGPCAVSQGRAARPYPALY